MSWTSTLATPFDQKETDAALAAWLDARCGHLTASRMGAAMSFLKNGNPSQKRLDLMNDLLAERLCDASIRHYVTPAMEWGTQTEPEAALDLEEHLGIKLTRRPYDFVTHSEIGFFGATPDGWIGGTDLAEIKCPTTQTFIEWRVAGVVPEEHKPQMLAQLACTKRDRVLFYAYDPRIKDKKLRRFWKWYEPSPADITSIELYATRFLNELDELFNQFVTSQS